MGVSFEYLQRCAAETGFQPGILEKVVRLGELAGDIARHPRLGEALALKGGTPLNLAFGPPRPSNRATFGLSSSSPISRPRPRDWPSTRRCSGSSPTYGASPEARALVFEANG